MSKCKGLVDKKPFQPLRVSKDLNPLSKTPAVLKEYSSVLISKKRPTPTTASL